MSDLSSFKEVIDLWTSREAMAADVGVGSWVVTKWWQRDSLPAEYWSRVLGTECAAKAGLTAEHLTFLAAREPAEARS